MPSPVTQLHGVGYAPQERKVFEALPKDGRTVTTVEVTQKIYGRSSDRPFYDLQTVLGALKSLAKKVEANNEPFRILRSARCGPHPIEFWIEVVR